MSLRRALLAVPALALAASACAPVDDEPTATDPAGAFGDWPYAKTCLDGPVFALADVAL